MTRVRSVLAMLMVLGAVLLGAPIALGEAEVSTELFQQTGHYELVMDGQPLPAAKLYLAKGMPRLIIVSEKLATPYLLTAGERTVAPLEPEAVQVPADDQDAVLVDLTRTHGKAQSVALNGRALLFGVEKHRFKVQPPEAIVGDLSGDELIARLPEFRRGVRVYQPKRGNLRLLQTLEQPVEILVIMGSWCAHCERIVPRLARVVQEVGSENLRVHYRLVTRKISEDPIARQYGVDAVPTIILLEEGQEKTRLDPATFADPESALATALFGG